LKANLGANLGVVIKFSFSFQQLKSLTHKPCDVEENTPPKVTFEVASILGFKSLCTTVACKQILTVLIIYLKTKIKGRIGNDYLFLYFIQFY
jgi:hypothetical protein